MKPLIFVCGIVVGAACISPIVHGFSRGSGLAQGEAIGAAKAEREMTDLTTSIKNQRDIIERLAEENNKLSEIADAAVDESKTLLARCNALGAEYDRALEDYKRTQVPQQISDLNRQVAVQETESNELRRQLEIAERERTTFASMLDQLPATEHARLKEWAMSAWRTQ